MLEIKIQAMWGNVNKKGESYLIFCSSRNNHWGFRNFKYLSICVNRKADKEKEKYFTNRTSHCPSSFY